jgi:hypothetical protein
VDDSGDGSSGSPREDEGVAFPLVDGERSTTATGSAVFADAARSLDPGLADAIEADDTWYRSYVEFVERLLRAELDAGDGASAFPAVGLDSAHRRFEFIRDGQARSLGDALAEPREPGLYAVRVRGRGEQAKELTVPYAGEELAGDRLRRQLDQWTEAGTVEPSFAEAIRLVVDNPDWLDLSDRTVVVLGAGAEMGPLASFCRWNADVVAVDLPDPELWERILRDVHSGTARVTVPTRTRIGDVDDDELASVAGVDLITETPEVAAWLTGLDGAVTLGNYVYADGADNVRVSMAADALAVHLAERLDDLSLAVLATPTDVFAVPEETVEAAQRGYEGRGPLRRTLGRVSGERLYAPNYGDPVQVQGTRFGLADCLVPQQGPNYILAKRIHRWRARVAREQGLVSSINVAPPTRTRSVTKNRVLAAAYRGAHRFDVEIFEPATARVLMAAALVHDLRNPSSVAHPRAELRHPLEVLAQGANHGGLWRQPFAPRSVLNLAVLVGMMRRG